jgi:hypothetical protein
MYVLYCHDSYEVITGALALDDVVITRGFRFHNRVAFVQGVTLLVEWNFIISPL